MLAVCHSFFGTANSLTSASISSGPIMFLCCDDYIRADFFFDFFQHVYNYLGVYFRDVFQWRSIRSALVFLFVT